MALLTNNMKTAGTATQEELVKQTEAYRTEFENMRAAVADGGDKISQQRVADAQEAYLLAAEQMMLGSGMTQEQVQTELAELAYQIGLSGVPEAAGAEAAEATDAMSSTLAAGESEVQAGAEAMTSGAETELQNSDLPEAGASAASGTGAAMENTLKGEAALAGAGAASLINTVKQGVDKANLPAATQAQGKAGGAQMAGGLQSETGTVSKAVSRLIDVLKKGLASGNLNHHFLQEGKQTAQSLANGLKSQSGVAGSSAGVVVASIKMAVSGLPAYGQTVGSQFSTGMANGIRSGAAGVASAAAEVARKAAESARANLDIHSPSRVMEKVGYWYDEGLGGGIRKYGDRVIQAADSLVSELLISPRQLARSVQSAFDGNIMRIAERYASAQNRIPGEAAFELDYNRLAGLLADALADSLDGLIFKIFDREFARLVREVEHAI